MKRDVKRRRCAIYTRVSTEHGLEQDFNSFDAQREAAEAYIKSQAHEGCLLRLRLRGSVRTARHPTGSFKRGAYEPEPGEDKGGSSAARERP